MKIKVLLVAPGIVHSKNKKIIIAIIDYTSHIHIFSF